PFIRTAAGRRSLRLLPTPDGGMRSPLTSSAGGHTGRSGESARSGDPGLQPRRATPSQQPEEGKESAQEPTGGIPSGSGTKAHLRRGFDPHRGREGDDGTN